jgi:lambda family phage portal protein
MIWPFKRKKAEIPNKRTFAAAQISRLTASWATNSKSYDWDIKLSLNILRSRSRDLCMNNDYAKKFLQMVAAHVVGPTGFSLQVRSMDQDMKGVKTLDQLASRCIEESFDRWGKKGKCDVTGKHSFFDLCNLYIKAVARDGEVLMRKVYGRQAGEFGFALQILDIDRLDINKNEVFRDGSMIKMGVELNKYGKPVAYHLRTVHPGDNPYYMDAAGHLWERIPAEDIYHHFISDRPEQNRGVPWMHAAMLSLQNLGGYQEAAIIASRIGASKMGFYTTPEGDGTALADEVTTTGELMQEADPGTFGVLPQGYGFTPFNPDYPQAMFAEFMKTCLRGIASGLGVAYNTISNDLEGVNFSSIRTGVLEERDNWMVIQKWMIENFLDDVFTTWLKFALLSGAIKLPNGSALPIAKFDKFNAGKWQGRRWQWVDPMKDVQANILAINNGLRSRTDVISDQGRDIEDVLMQLAEEQEKIKTLGIQLESLQPNPAPGAPNDKKNPADAEAEDES